MTQFNSSEIVNAFNSIFANFVKESHELGREPRYNITEVVLFVIRILYMAGVFQYTDKGRDEILVSVIDLLDDYRNGRV